MSDEFTGDHERKGSDAVENGHQTYEAEQPFDPTLKSAVRLDLGFSAVPGVISSDAPISDDSLVNSGLQVEQEANGSIHFQSSVGISQLPKVDDGVRTDIEGDKHERSWSHKDPQDDESGVLMKMDDNLNGEFGDVKLEEDSGRDDMFVDAPDELSSYDGRKTDNREEMEVTSKAYEGSDEMHNIQETHFQISDNNEHQIHQLKGELSNLRAMLEKTAAEKETMAQGYKSEREAFVKELAELHNQLKDLSNQQLMLDENDHQVELIDREDEIHMSNITLQMMMNKCSDLLRKTLDERNQTEGTIRELHATLYMKDQEIQDLNAKLTEISSACDGFLEKNEHIEVVMNRILASLATVVNQEELLDNSIAGKISHAEKSASMLVGYYNWVLAEIDQLRKCLMETSPDVGPQLDLGTFFTTARNELIELKRKEIHFMERMSHMEDENRRLVEYVERKKEMLEMANAEVEKFKLELEHEKTKYANTKEKLSMAVTKGKALVQQRDSLKQSLADKTTELEKRLIELQENSKALEAAEVAKEELVKSESLAASLTEVLSQKENDSAKLEELLSQTSLPESIQSSDMVENFRWIVDEMNSLKGISLEFSRLKDEMSLIDLPEAASSLELQSKLTWLGESYCNSKDKINKLQDEMAVITEAAQNEIDRLSTWLLMESQEKEFLQLELEALKLNYDEVVRNEHRASLENDQIISMLFETSGIKMDKQETEQRSLDVVSIVEECIGKIKEQCTSSFEFRLLMNESFERVKGLLYVKNQELTLYENVLTEEIFERSEVNMLSNKLREASEEILALKEERISLQKDLARSEEKSALIREKLSMAVKKGKGLVQDRENIKLQLEVKNSEIEKLKLELHQQVSKTEDFKEQINRLSSHLERIPLLEAELAASEDKRNQLEQLLAVQNNEIEKLKVESHHQESTIGDLKDQINKLITDLESIPKLEANLIAVEDQRDQLEQLMSETNSDLEKLKVESQHQDSTIEALKDQISRLSTDLERIPKLEADLVAVKQQREQLEQFLDDNGNKIKKLKFEFEKQESTLGEYRDEINRLLNDLQPKLEAELVTLKDQKDQLELFSAASNNVLQRATQSTDGIVLPISPAEKVKRFTERFHEFFKKSKTLEQALLAAENNIAQLTEEKRELEIMKSSTEQELHEARKEASSLAGKFHEAVTTRKLLEDALLVAENNISVLVGAKDDSQVIIEKMKEEVVDRSSKLEEAYRTIRSLEEEKNNAQVSIKSLEDAMLKAENNISVLVGEKNMAEEEIMTLNSKLSACMEELTGAHGSFESRSGETLACIESLQVIVKDESLLALLWTSFEKTFERLKDVDSLLKNIKEHFIQMDPEMLLSHPVMKESSFASKVFSVDRNNFVQFGAIDSELKEVVGGDILSCLREMVEGFNWKDKFLSEKFEGFSSFIDESISALLIELRATKDEATLVHEQMESLKLKVKNTERCKEANENRNACLENDMKDLQNKLKEMEITSEKAIEERDINRNKVSKLETDVKELESLCSEMRLKLEDFQAKEEKLKESLAELSSLHDSVLMKEQESGKTLLSTSQMEILCDKVAGIEIPLPELEVSEPEVHKVPQLKKLYYIIDGFIEWQQQLTLLSHVKEELEQKLATQALEIEHLKDETTERSKNKQDLERVKSEIFVVRLGLESIIQKLGGTNDLLIVNKSDGARELGEYIPLLEKLITALLLEAENAKLQVKELEKKLFGSQEIVDDLNTKVKLLENSIQSSAVIPVTVQERSIFEAPSLPNESEITEIEDVASVGMKSISPVPSAAHVRTMRKGSNDHLALNIDLESQRLVTTKETDEDKGHVFKSLNTSGLVPRQGKLIADRIDGIWVSGGRVLMSRPRARLGLIAYWLLVHIWLLGTIL